MLGPVGSATLGGPILQNVTIVRSEIMNAGIHFEFGFFMSSFCVEEVKLDQHWK